MFRLRGLSVCLSLELELNEARFLWLFIGPSGHRPERSLSPPFELVALVFFV